MSTMQIHWVWCECYPSKSWQLKHSTSTSHDERIKYRCACVKRHWHFCYLFININITNNNIDRATAAPEILWWKVGAQLSSEKFCNFFCCSPFEWNDVSRFACHQFACFCTIPILLWINRRRPFVNGETSLCECVDGWCTNVSVCESMSMIRGSEVLVLPKAKKATNVTS